MDPVTISALALIVVFIGAVIIQKLRRNAIEAQQNEQEGLPESTQISVSNPGSGGFSSAYKQPPAPWPPAPASRSGIEPRRPVDDSNEALTGAVVGLAVSGNAEGAVLGAAFGGFTGGLIAGEIARESEPAPLAQQQEVTVVEPSGDFNDLKEGGSGGFGADPDPSPSVDTSGYTPDPSPSYTPDPTPDFSAPDTSSFTSDTGSGGW